MTELIFTLEGITEQETTIDSLVSPEAVVSAFNYVYVGVSGDVIRSADGKQNWVTESAGLTGIVTAFKYHTDNNLYCGTDLGNLYKKSTFDGVWSQVGSSQSTRFHDIASKSGDKVYIAGEDGKVYESDGSTLGVEYDTTETACKSVAVWDGKIYASTTGAKIYYDAGSGSWSLQSELSGDTIGHIWRMLESDGKLSGVSDDGRNYIHDSHLWGIRKISGNYMHTHGQYLDKEVCADSSGDLYFREGKQWKKKQTFAHIVGLYEHKGNLICTVSGDDLVKRINYVVIDDYSNWEDNFPSRPNSVENLKRDGAVSDLRQYNSAASIAISGIGIQSDYSTTEAKIQKIQQSMHNREFKLWFEEDKYLWAKKMNVTKRRVSPAFQGYSLQMVSDDPYKYSNQKNFNYINLAWTDDNTNISQTSGDTALSFGTTTEETIRQKFKARQNTISKVTIKTGGNTGTPSGDVLAKLRNSNDVELTSVTIASGDWAEATEMEISFNYAPITIDNEYRIVLSGDQTFDDNNYRTVSGAKLSNEYQSGNYGQSVADTYTETISGDLWFKVNNCEKSITINNAGTAPTRPRVLMKSTSGDLINSRITNIDANGEQTLFRYTDNVIQNNTVTFDSQKRSIFANINNAMNFFSGDFLEMSAGDNVVKIQAAPSRFEFEYNDMWY
jgi:hypothetical protein